MNWLLDAIGDVGYALDTPGAYLRGALAGRPGERSSGEELLSSYGVDGGMLGGMAAEMVLDPLALAGPAFGAFKGVQGINRATRGLAGLAHADDANPLLRGLAGLGDETASFEPFRRVGNRRGAYAGAAAAPDWMVLNAGVRESAARPMPEEVARLTKMVDDSGNPAPVYHGTRGYAGDRTREGGRPSGDFEQFDPAKIGGLIHFTDRPSIAARYAHGSGGSRASRDHILADQAGNVYTVGGSGTGDFAYHYRGSLADGLRTDEIFTPDLANLVERSGVERVIDPQRAQRRVDDGDYRAFLEGAVLRKHFLDVRNPLNLDTTEGLEAFAALNPSTPQGRDIVAAARKRHPYGHLQDPRFDWGDTKYEPIHRTFQNDLNPLLKGLGHDGIYFSDDGHDTLSVFDPSQVYDPLVARARGAIRGGG